MNMTAAQRAASYPPSMFDVPVKDQIVRYGDGQAMSVPVGDNVGGAMIQRPKTEFEILHDTAQRNAALPVEQGGLGLPEGNTAMERAGAMGFDTPAYHDSGEELRVINNEKLKRNAYGKGLHSASDPELANIFANHSSEGQNVSPLLLRLGNQASKEDYKNAMNQVWDEGGHDATKIRQLLIDKGFEVKERVPLIPIDDESVIIEKIMSFNWTKDFVEGERNSFIFDLAGSFCEYGINESTALGYIQNNVVYGDFSETETKNTIKSAYKIRGFN